jgi:hypothetical protein
MKICCKQTKYHSKCYYCSGANTKSGCVLDRSFHFHTWALTVCIAKYLYHTLDVRWGAVPRKHLFWLAAADAMYSIFWFISNVDAPIHELWHFGEQQKGQRGARRVARQLAVATLGLCVYSKHKWSIIFDVTAPFKEKKRKPLYWWALVIPRVNIVSHARELAAPGIARSLFVCAFKCINALCVAFGARRKALWHTQRHTLLRIYSLSHSHSMI